MGKKSGKDSESLPLEVREEDDGIFVKRKRVFRMGAVGSAEAKKQAWTQFSESIKASNEEEAAAIESLSWLDGLESWSNEIEEYLFQTYGIEEFCKAVSKVSEKERNLLRECRELRAHIHDLRKALDNGNEKRALWWAQWVGYQACRLDVVLDSPHLKRGVKTLEAASQGHASVHGTPEEKMCRWAEYQKAYDALRTRRPNLSKTECKRRIAKRMGVSIKTIQRHVRS